MALFSSTVVTTLKVCFWVERYKNICATEDYGAGLVPTIPGTEVEMAKGPAPGEDLLPGPRGRPAPWPQGKTCSLAPGEDLLPGPRGRPAPWPQGKTCSLAPGEDLLPGLRSRDECPCSRLPGVGPGNPRHSWRGKGT
ncbi:hypothetical protein COCON_G00227340 [Conger conger]|uniref:Uncharacterized protein n=1 Tax=Conger conger TaxID=82655 RepID=A0A9Q1CXP0_CONCO|nr:hypothetical protein COCON_G00227340 [Conger conger]